MFRWLQERRRRKLNERYKQENSCVNCGHADWLHVDECFAVMFNDEGRLLPCPCRDYLQPIRMETVYG